MSSLNLYLYIVIEWDETEYRCITEIEKSFTLGEIAALYYMDTSDDVINVTACHHVTGLLSLDRKSITLKDLNLTFRYFTFIEFVTTISAVWVVWSIILNYMS